jgi:hypothetical protein
VFSPASRLAEAIELAVITPLMAPDSVRKTNIKQLHYFAAAVQGGWQPNPNRLT